LCFVTFSVLLIFSLFDFVDFLSFFVDFHVDDEFLIIFVSKLGASIMTHFSPGVSALPLSPFW